MSKPIRAVHDDDLAGFLRSLGVFSEIQGGRARCFLCGSRISMEAFHAAVPDSGSVKLVCDQAACVAGLTAWLAERA